MDAFGTDAGVQRLEEEEKKKEENSAAGTEPEVTGGNRVSVMSGQTESRADDFATVGLWHESLCGKIQWGDGVPVTFRAGAHCDVSWLQYVFPVRAFRDDAMQAGGHGECLAAETASEECSLGRG